MKRKRIILLILIAVILIGSIFLIIHTNLKRAFKRTFGIALPKCLEVINYKYSLYYDCMYLKASFGEDDYDLLRESLLGVYGAVEKQPYEDLWLPNCQNSVDWWDLEKPEILYVIYGFNGGSKNTKSTESLWIIITQPSDGEYFLFATNIG